MILTECNICRWTYKMGTGGALAIQPSMFTAINGFSNRFWGWGNEDDNMYTRFGKFSVFLKTMFIYDL